VLVFITNKIRKPGKYKENRAKITIYQTIVSNAAVLRVACVAGVNRKGEGEREHGRKIGFWKVAPSPPFSPAFSFPFPFPVYTCYAGYS